MKAAFFIFIILVTLPFSFAQQSSCDYKIEVLLNGEEFEKEEFKWKMKATKIEGASTNITGTAKIKDSNGKAVKTYKPWTSDSISKQKTSSEYSPNLKEGGYEITAEINVECDDVDKGNNIDAKKIKIKGDKEQKSKESKSEAAKKIIKANKIDNMETTQNKATNEETDTINQKTKPRKLISNEETDNVIQLADKKGQENKELQQSTAYAIKSQQIVYESSNEKAKALIILFLLTLSILLNIILIWKR